jgi:hypothetical protein
LKAGADLQPTHYQSGSQSHGKNGRKWRGFDFSARAYFCSKPLLLKGLSAFTSATLDQTSAIGKNQHPALVLADLEPGLAKEWQ